MQGWGGWYALCRDGKFYVRIAEGDRSQRIDTHMKIWTNLKWTLENLVVVDFFITFVIEIIVVLYVCIFRGSLSSVLSTLDGDQEYHSFFK